MQMAKYEALGNDYLVLPVPPESLHRGPSPELARQICDRHFGIGSDGILVGTSQPAANGCFQLRIINPDGSEAEKSGNGLRIYAKYLWHVGAVNDQRFRIQTLGGDVQCLVYDDGRRIDVAMGKVSFDSTAIPVTGPRREVLRERLTVSASDGEEYDLEYSAATVGNPHCVIICDELDVEQVTRLGPLLEHAPPFPNRTNVQFVRILDRGRIQIEIWERGAGYTLASGSSSSAAAATAHRLGYVDQRIEVEMPGGRLWIEVDDDFEVRMIGPATKVADVTLDADWLAERGG